MKPLKTLTVASLSAVIAACGGGGGGTPSASTVSLTGTASKGILIGADVAAYAVENGKQAATPLATGKTDADGNYDLKVSPTDGPVIVVVKVNDSTQMLDETQLDGNSYKKIPAPKDFMIRSFAAKVDQDVVVRVNPYTEMAVAVADSATSSSGAKVGLTVNSLIAGQ